MNGKISIRYMDALPEIVNNHLEGPRHYHHYRHLSSRLGSLEILTTLSFLSRPNPSYQQEYLLTRPAGQQ